MPAHRLVAPRRVRLAVGTDEQACRVPLFPPLGQAQPGGGELVTAAGQAPAPAADRHAAGPDLALGLGESALECLQAALLLEPLGLRSLAAGLALLLPGRHRQP